MHSQGQINANDAMVMSLPSYNAALKSLQTEIQTNDHVNATLLHGHALCCIATFLHGRQEAVLIHLAFFAALEKQGFPLQDHPDTLSVLAGFDHLNMLYGQPTASHLQDRRALNVADPCGYEPFDDLHGAHKACQLLSKRTLAFIRASENSWHAERQVHSLTRATLVQEAHTTEENLMRISADFDPTEQAKMNLLVAQARTSCLISVYPPTSASALSKVDVIRCHEIVDLIGESLKQLFSAEERPPLLSLGTGIIPTLCTLGLYSHEPNVQRNVIRVLQCAPQVEGLFAAEESICILKHVMHLEESTQCRIMQIETERHDLDTISLKIRYKDGNDTRIIKVNEIKIDICGRASNTRPRT